MCSICLDDLRTRPEGSKGKGRVKQYTIKNCQHSYHKSCIDEWYAFESKRGKICACPLCRSPDTKHPSYTKRLREMNAKSRHADGSRPRSASSAPGASGARAPSLFQRLRRAASWRSRTPNSQRRLPHALPSANNRARPRSNTHPQRSTASSLTGASNSVDTSNNWGEQFVVARATNHEGAAYVVRGSIRQTATGGRVFVLAPGYTPQPEQERASPHPHPHPQATSAIEQLTQSVRQMSLPVH